MGHILVTGWEPHREIFEIVLSHDGRCMNEVRVGREEYNNAGSFNGPRQVGGSSDVTETYSDLTISSNFFQFHYMSKCSVQTLNLCCI
jgi:hypothetical protein